MRQALSSGTKQEPGKARQFASNSFWLAASVATAVLTASVFRLAIGRVLGPSQYGRYAFIQTFVAYFLVLAYFGVRSVVAREVGRDPSKARAYLAASLKIRAVTAVTAMLCSWAVGYALHRGGQVTLGIVIMSLSILALAVGELLEGVLAALQRSFFVALSNLVGNVAKLALVLWALRAGYGLIGVIWVSVAASTLMAITNWRFVKHVLSSQGLQRSEPGRVRYVLKESRPFLLMSAAGKLYAKNDILFLALLRGDAITGIYSAAYVFVDLLISVSGSFNWTAYSMAARLYGEAEDKKPLGMGLSEAYGRLHKHLLMIFLPVSALLMLFGRESLMLFGNRFLGGLDALRVLVWVPPAEVSCVLSGCFLSATYRQRLEARIAAAITALNIGWTVSFIVLFGAVGAAVATIGASLINAAVRYIYVTRTLGKTSVVDVWVRPIACTAAMLLVAQRFMGVFWMWRLAVALMVYALAVAVVRPYDAEDRRLLRSILRR